MKRRKKKDKPLVGYRVQVNGKNEKRWEEWIFDRMDNIYLIFFIKIIG